MSIRQTLGIALMGFMLGLLLGLFMKVAPTSTLYTIGKDGKTNGVLFKSEVELIKYLESRRCYEKV